jgi:hypothetical protein
MEAEPAFRFFMVLALIAAVYAFLQSWKVNTRLRALRLWMEQNAPERWQALPWWHRSLGRPAVERLRAEGMDGNPEFARQYAAYRQALGRLTWSGTVGLLMIGLAILFQRFS